MMEHRVVSDDGLIVEEGGCVIDVRLPWYRSLPLSVVEIGQVVVDGQLIDPARITFELEGQRYRLDELRPHTDVWWYVLDSAFLHIAGLPLLAGGEHQVSVTIQVRPPYINGLNRIVKTEKRLKAREGVPA
ncbi:MAG TPA: DUF6379 domain-containing protein [Novosphingobium sp.]|nr:DUF6379 domain-containing protein [Novosphingobium sp.]